MCFKIVVANLTNRPFVCSAQSRERGMCKVDEQCAVVVGVIRSKCVQVFSSEVKVSTQVLRLCKFVPGNQSVKQRWGQGCWR